MPSTDNDAHDAPHRKIIDRADESGAGQSADLRPGTDVAPAHRLVVSIAHHSRRMLPFAQAPHRLLPAPLAQAIDLCGLQPMRQAPAMVAAAVAVDDISEVVEALCRHGVRLPPHGPTPSRRTDGTEARVPHAHRFR